MPTPRLGEHGPVHPRSCTGPVDFLPLPSGQAHPYAGMCSRYSRASAARQFSAQTPWSGPMLESDRFPPQSHMHAVHRIDRDPFEKVPGQLVSRRAQLPAPHRRPVGHTAGLGRGLSPVTWTFWTGVHDCPLHSFRLPPEEQIHRPCAGAANRGVAHRTASGRIRSGLGARASRRSRGSGRTEPMGGLYGPPRQGRARRTMEVAKEAAPRRP